MLKKASAYGVDDQFFTPVPGESITTFLEPVIGSPSLDIAGALAAMEASFKDTSTKLLLTSEDLSESEKILLLEEAEGPQSVDAGAIKAFHESQRPKETFASTGFKRDNEAFFAKTSLDLMLQDEYSLLSETVTWMASSDRFTVSVLDRMPVRDQGQRGTCAAHAGIAQLEAFLLKKYPELKGLDLSEQRFYYLSKPEHWKDGGNPSEEGSNSGSGLASSARYDWTKVDTSWNYPSEVPTTYNIPLEKDCPYKAKRGTNDLQIPQPATCTKGVVQVQGYASWVKNASADLKTPQEIYDFLLTKDYPVITATRLSDNWENNDGIITLKDAGQPSASIHAGGHAYLIVGARKLSESEYPGEGGMCFIIRNSWGKGWGINGLSCMTLAWFNAWRFKNSSFGLVTDATVDKDALNLAKTNEEKVPTDIEKDQEPPTTDPVGTLTKRRGTARISALLDDANLESDSDYTVGRLIGPNDQSFKILYKVEDQKLYVQGVLSGEKKTTKALTLPLNDKNQVTATVGGRMEVPFGELDKTSKELVLCSKAYARVCTLNYLESGNQLLVGATEFEAASEESTEPFSWQGTSLAGYGIEISLPSGRTTSLDMRFKIKGEYTNPQRFSVNPLAGDIKWHGKTIGNYQKLALCSGSFSSVCRIVVSGQNFQVVPKAQKQ
jgi:C1A family cysteine protease